MHFRKHPFLWLLALVGAIIFALSSVGEFVQSGKQETIHRDRAGQLAAKFLEQQGISTDDHIRTELYQGDSDMDAYLQRHKLTEEFSALPSALPLSYWTVTFQRPGIDNYRVWLHETSGNVLGYELNRPTSGKERADTPKKGAELAFKELGIRGVPLADVEYQGYEQDENGLLYTFKNKAWKLGDSELIHTIQVTDGQTTGYSAHYQIPQEDLDWLQEQDKSGMILTVVSLLGMVLLVVFSLIIAFSFPKGEVNWNRGIMLSLILLGVGLLSNLNSWPELLANFDMFERVPIEFILWGIAMFIVGVVVLSTAGTYVTAVAGGVLSGRLWPEKWLAWSHPEWPARIRAAAFRGYLLAFVFLGLQTVFYIISEKWFGVWYENDFSMSPWNFLVPGLFPLLAWTAGIGEEIMFRLLGVGLVKRYLGSTFLALLLPAMVWALAHSLYPVHPFYTRFIELTLLGMVIGWFFLKFDLETVIFAHVVIDTILMAMPLLAGGTGADKVWAVAWLILPGLIGVYAHRLQPRGLREGSA